MTFDLTDSPAQYTTHTPRLSPPSRQTRELQWQQ